MQAQPTREDQTTVSCETHEGTRLSPGVPVHDAMCLTDGGGRAHIVLGTQTYVLKVTRAGKLILTK